MLACDLTPSYDEEFTLHFLYLKLIQFYGSDSLLNTITFD